MKIYLLLVLLFLTSLAVRADLVVGVGLPKTVGQKTIIKLDLKNTFREKIESARAVIFLLDKKGKMVAQSTKWVIGGTQARPGLAPGATNSFSIVLTTPELKPESNLTAKVSFSSVILEDGKLADPTKNVIISGQR